MMGPIDYVIVGFEGNGFDGSILEALAEAVDKGIIRVVDLLFIMKDENGEIVEGEYADQTGELRQALGEFELDDDGLLLSEEDIEKVGKDLKNNTAAGILVIEHLWAKKLKQALIDAGGFLIGDGRIHPDAVETALKELQAEGAK